MAKQFTISDGVKSFTGYEKVTAQPVYNSNVEVTIGGIPVQQADTERLRITSRMALTETELATVKDILNSFTREITYTPSRPLYGATSATELDVILDGAPQVNVVGWNGTELVYYLTVVMQEVISS